MPLGEGVAAEQGDEDAQHSEDHERGHEKNHHGAQASAGDVAEGSKRRSRSLRATFAPFPVLVTYELDFPQAPRCRPSLSWAVEPTWSRECSSFMAP